MNPRILNILLILTSLLGYLEWGTDSSMFLYEAEFEVLDNLIKDPKSAIHPLTILPLLGQLFILITIFQPSPNKRLTYLGISLLGILLGFMFIIGVIDFNYKILLSTLPFIIVSIMVMLNFRKIMIDERLGN